MSSYQNYSGYYTPIAESGETEHTEFLPYIYTAIQDYPEVYDTYRIKFGGVKYNFSVLFRITRRTGLKYARAVYKIAPGLFESPGPYPRHVSMADELELQNGERETCRTPLFIIDKVA